MQRNAFVTLLILIFITTACGQPTSEQPEPSPPTEIAATPAPTETPSPTDTPERVESGFYTHGESGWAPVYQDEMTVPVFLPEDMVGGDLDMMQRMQYGYFAAFDPDTNILTAHINVPPGALFRKLDFQLRDDQNVICLPDTVSSTPIEDIQFMPNNGSVSFPAGTGKQAISDIEKDLHDGVYLVIVLPEAVTQDIANPVSQLAMVCP